MKLLKHKDISFIALVGAASALFIGYACATSSNPRSIDVRTLAPLIDTSEFTPTEIKRFETVLNTQTSPCGHDVTLAESLRNADHCPLTLPAAEFVMDMIKQDYNVDEIADAYLMRYAELKGLSIPRDGSPVKGAEKPVVTFVVFTDFQCPHCGKTAEKLDELVRIRPEHVALVHKNFPLTSIHPQSDLAARAAFAAGVQEKFWEMHDTLFSTVGSELTRERIDTIAAGLGLDIDKFEEDISSTAATAAIESDRELGQSLGVNSTPTIFINGRRIENGYKGIEERLHEELLRAGRK